MASFHETRTEDREAGEAGDDRGPLTPGVRRALIAALGAVAVAAVPYLLPGARAYRLWVPEDPAPFAEAFRGPGGFVRGGNPRQRIDGSPGERFAERARGERSGEELLASVTTSVAGSVEEGVDAEGLVEAPRGTSRWLDRLSSRADGAALVARHAPDQLWRDVAVRIHDPHGAMRPFYRQLLRTARDAPGAVTRVSHWGDSVLVEDHLTAAVRERLQERFGDAGHGFVLAAPDGDMYERQGVELSYGGNWQPLRVLDDETDDDRYGLGGVAGHGYLGAWTRVRPTGERTASRLLVYHLTAPGYGRLAVEVDGERETVVDTEAESIRDAVHEVEVPDGPRTFEAEVIGGGPVRLYGLALERDGPGVVYDGLGLMGARSWRLLNADPRHWTEQLRLRAPDLMILMYGGNQLAEEELDIPWYTARYRELLRRYRRARPTAACLVMSPVDHGERHRGRIRTEPRLYDLMAAQREAALAEGCAWYSTFRAMGGEGSMGRWYRREPRWGWGDLAHPTPRGAEVLGTRFFRALMAGFADYLRELGR